MCIFLKCEDAVRQTLKLYSEQLHRCASTHSIDFFPVCTRLFVAITIHSTPMLQMLFFFSPRDQGCD